MTVTSALPIQGRKALWHLAPPLASDIRSALEDFSPMLCHLLYCRGYQTRQEIEAFFSQGVISHDPFLLPDMEAAVERIVAAIERQERVAIYGDFDCDGITSSAVLLSTLQGCALDPDVHIPTRADGHGLQVEALQTLKAEGVSLLITGDCGIGAIDEVRVARDIGMDVIVTDHHEPRADGSLPNCLTISPTCRESQYPYRFLSGVGVTYKLAQALSTRLPNAPSPEDVLDLVALGTVADVVPLRDENRSLVIQGLQRLREARRPGLIALFGAAGVDQSRIDPVTVGYYLAPRINAANRMATPQLAYDLITAADLTVAARLAAQLSAFNEERQALVAEKFADITEEIGPAALIASQVMQAQRPPVLAVIGDWPPGISGLLASKLVDEYGLPAFVGSDMGEGIVSVSARGIPGVHIDEILESCEQAVPGGLFLGHGGHSGAGGFRLPEGKLGMAIQVLHEQGSKHVPLTEVGAVLRVDAEVSLSQICSHEGLRAAQKIRELAPFGAGFEEPLFLCRGVTLRSRSTMGDRNQHAKFAVQGRDARIDGLLWHAHPSFLELPLPSTLDIVFHLQLSERNGMVKPEISLRDWRLASCHGNTVGG